MFKPLIIIAPVYTALLLSANAYGDATTPYLPGASNMTLCSDMVVDSNPRLTPALTQQTLNGTASCSSGVAGGGGGWGGGLGICILGVVFAPSCPPDQPYLAGISEGWGGFVSWFACAGGTGMTVTCCSTPQPVQMSFTTGYKSGSYNTWQSGADCQ